MAQEQAGMQGPPQEGGDDMVNQLTDLVDNLHAGLGILADAASGANPAVAEKVKALQAGLEEVVAEITGGAGQPPQAGGGMAEMNQGATGVPESQAGGMPRR